jgi:glycosyltransferase involved in cell wall biosynthesis
MGTPRVTIGLVVRNGERHLAAAIESLVAQTFADFELVIYDNASDDRTPEIATQWAHRDARVRLVRRERNIGAVGNIIDAAERATGEFFAWAAHDDLREPGFLAALVELLDRHPSAALACCSVRDMHPDGRDAGVRPETNSLRTTEGMRRAERLCMYLREAPGTPFYGLFRTAMLKPSLEVLRRDAMLDGVPVLGLDMVFLADVLRRNDLAIVAEPLLRFRFGGWSHRLDVYGSLWAYLRHVRFLAASLARATRADDASLGERIALTRARWRFLCRHLASPPMRRMTWHYLAQAWPWLSRTHARWASRHRPELVALAERARTLPRGATVVLFGAGKHTKRCLDAIRRALGPTTVVAIADDAAASAPIAPIDGIAVVAPSELSRIRPAAILVSSDTFEAGLLRRALESAPNGCPVWALYDRSLEESCRAEISARSTVAMNERSASIASAA